MAYCMPKVAVALLLIRLMGPGHRRKCFLYLLISVVVIAGIVSGILLFVQCKPVAALWDPAIAATANRWDPSRLKHVGYFIGGTLPCYETHLYKTDLEKNVLCLL